MYLQPWFKYLGCCPVILNYKYLLINMQNEGGCYGYYWLLTWLCLEWTKIQKWRAIKKLGLEGVNPFLVDLWSRNTQIFDSDLEAWRHTFNMANTFCWKSILRHRKWKLLLFAHYPCFDNISILSVVLESTSLGFQYIQKISWGTQFYGTEQLLDYWTLYSLDCNI